MPTIQELEKRSYEIDLMVQQEIVSDKPDIKVICDGILDFKKYCSAKYKILWILKDWFVIQLSYAVVRAIRRCFCFGKQ